MKKLFLFAAMAVCALTANAQSDNSNYWYARAGIGINGASNIEDSKAKVGYNVEVGYAWLLGEQGAHVDVGLGVASRGWKSEYTDEEEGQSIKTTDKLTAHNLYLAPTFGWRIPVGSNVYIDPHAGLYLGFDLGGKYKTEYSYSKELIDAAEQVGYELPKNEDVKIGDIDGYKKFDMGMRAGAGVWIKNFNIDFTYKLGFTKQFDGNKAPHTHSFDITVAYAF